MQALRQLLFVALFWTLPVRAYIVDGLPGASAARLCAEL